MTVFCPPPVYADKPKQYVLIIAVDLLPLVSRIVVVFANHPDAFKVPIYIAALSLGIQFIQGNANIIVNTSAMGWERESGVKVQEMG